MTGTITLFDLAVTDCDVGWGLISETTQALSNPPVHKCDPCISNNVSANS